MWLTVKNVGLYDSRWALILPSAISTYNLILLRSYFQSIPDSLVESVMIDGGGHLTILLKIFIPLSKPALMVMFLYYGIGHWNSWFSANISSSTQVNADVISLSQDFSQYKILILPTAFVLNEASAEKLKRYVEKGGTLIATFLTAVLKAFLEDIMTEVSVSRSSWKCSDQVEVITRNDKGHRYTFLFNFANKDVTVEISVPAVNYLTGEPCGRMEVMKRQGFLVFEEGIEWVKEKQPIIEI